MLIPGKCHCGNVSFELSWSPDPAEIPARALLRQSPASFDGEGTDTRLERRQRNWIADVAFGGAVR